MLLALQLNNLLEDEGEGPDPLTGIRTLVQASVGDRGLMIFPGQSPEEVLAAAAVIDRLRGSGDVIGTKTLIVLGNSSPSR